MMKLKFWSILSLFFSSAIISPASAQITIDGSTNTTLTPTDNGVRIDEGDRAGGNLFHSFGEFSVGIGREAFFNNASDIINIFSRVTGGNISNIDGLIRANGSANLFLINPAGILFSEGASLNIGGSFYGSTADSILFPDGVEFAASNPVKPLLTINAPIGLKFRDNLGKIVVSNSILSNFSNTFALLGGEVTLTNTSIESFSGRVEIGAAGKGETIQLSQNPNGSWEVDYDNVTNFENIYINDSSIGSNITNLQAENIIINNSGIVTLLEEDETQQNQGGISLTATNSIQLDDSLLSSQAGNSNNTINLPEQFQNAVFLGGGGNISLNAREIILKNGSGVTASTFSEVPGGNINIEAKEYLEISGVNDDLLESNETSILPSFIAVTVDEQSSGSGGGITITTDRLNITDGSRIDSSTFGSGDAGTIDIKASTSITLSGQISVENLGQKDGGNITIKTDNLVLFDDSEIIANAPEAQGGNITINTQGLFPFDAVEQNLIQASGSNSSLDGEINISTPNTNNFQETLILPKQLLNAKISTLCNTGTSEFIVVGRGGIAPNTLETLHINPIPPDWVELPQEQNNYSKPSFSSISHSLLTPQIVEASGWIINENGKVELIADVNNVAGYNSWENPIQCTNN